MKAIKRKNKIDLITFNCALFLLFLSFFEESTLWKFSYIGLVAVFLFPIVLFVGMQLNCITLDSHDKQIVSGFCIFALIQCLGVSFSSIYKSLTPIYRTISVILTIIYIRHVIWTDSKFRALDVLSFFVILFGFISFLLPQQEDTNPFFGNLNTVGALYFSFFALNYIQFLKTHKYIKLLYSGLSVLLVIISNTRTAMFLILLAIVLCVAIKCFIGKNVKPLAFFVLSIGIIVLFIVSAPKSPKEHILQPALQYYCTARAVPLQWACSNTARPVAVARTKRLRLQLFISRFLDSLIVI